MPGELATTVDPVGFTVFSNDAGGYNVTVQPTSATLDGAGTDTIPFASDGAGWGTKPSASGAAAAGAPESSVGKNTNAAPTAHT